MNTFSGFCISACLFMIFLGMATVVVNDLDIFSSPPTIDTTTAQGYFSQGNVASVVWITGGIATLILVILAYARNMVNLIGLAIFSGIFWTSWISINSTFLSSFLVNPSTGVVQPAAAGIIAMLWLGMGVMYVGAVIGILVPGSTAMR